MKRKNDEKIKCTHTHTQALNELSSLGKFPDPVKAVFFGVLNVGAAVGVNADDRDLHVGWRACVSHKLHADAEELGFFGHHVAQVEDELLHQALSVVGVSFFAAVGKEIGEGEVAGAAIFLHVVVDHVLRDVLGVAVEAKVDVRFADEVLVVGVFDEHFGAVFGKRGETCERFSSRLLDEAGVVGQKSDDQGASVRVNLKRVFCEGLSRGDGLVLSSGDVKVVVTWDSSSEFLHQSSVL